MQQAAPGSTGGIAARCYSTTNFSLNQSLSDPATHTLALYLMDRDDYAGGRSERIDLIDDATGTVLSSQTVGSFQNGVDLVWQVSGNIAIRVTNLNPNSSAVLGEIFLSGAWRIRWTAARAPG